MLIYYVYAYLRSDGTPYYIGKGKESRAFDKTKNHYPPEDKSKIIFIKENLDEYEALDLEKRLIRWYGRKDLGTGILRNLTDGGEGCSGKIVSGETRRKIGEAQKGKTNSEEARRKMSEAAKRRKLSEETRRKISNSNKGRLAWSKGKIFSEETRRKMSEAKKGNKVNLGRKLSEETRRKLSEAVKAAKKRKKITQVQSTHPND